MQVMLCRLENSFTNMCPTILGRLRRMDVAYVMGGYFGGLRPVGRPRSRREVAVWRDEVDVLDTRLEDGGEGERMLECEVRRGHGPKTGRITT
jgi:hypothetical protein